MKNKVILIISIIAFISALVGIKLYQNSMKEEQTNNIKKGKTEEMNSVKVDIKEVSESNFEEEVLKSDKIVLVDFFADWCEPCKQIAPNIEKVANKRADIKFVKVNIDNNEKLADKYEVIYIPTLVVIKDGKVVNSSTGYISISKIENLLNVE